MQKTSAISCALLLGVAGCASDDMRHAIDEWRQTNAEIREANTRLRDQIDDLGDEQAAIARDVLEVREGFVEISDNVANVGEGLANLSDMEPVEQVATIAENAAPFIPPQYQPILWAVAGLLGGKFDEGRARKAARAETKTNGS